MDIFYHICALPGSDWVEIVKRQTNLIESSGLLNKVDSIYIGFLGKDKSQLDFLVKNNSGKYKIGVFSNYLRNYERLTLNFMYDYSKKQETSKKILYIHSKGITRNKGNDRGVLLWCDIMEYFLIENHDECISLLDVYDTIGLMALNSGKPKHKILDEPHCIHYSGNFWWTTTNYIKTLTRISESPKDMKQDCIFWLNERWILQNIHKKASKHVTLWQGALYLYGVDPKKYSNFKTQKKIQQIIFDTKFVKGNARKSGGNLRFLEV